MNVWLQFIHLLHVLHLLIYSNYMMREVWVETNSSHVTEGG